MSRHQIDYESLVQDAMRGLVRTVMQRIAKTGLPGDHHFYISFHTHAAGVSVSKRLLERYPDEMTIVLQNKFSDLKALDERFEVTLWFDSIAERLVIPYTSIKVFFDPSVPYGNQFEVPAAVVAPATKGPVLVDRSTVEPGPAEKPKGERPAAVTSMTTSSSPRSRQPASGPIVSTQPTATTGGAKRDGTRGDVKADVKPTAVVTAAPDEKAPAAKPAARSSTARPAIGKTAEDAAGTTGKAPAAGEGKSASPPPMAPSSSPAADVAPAASKVVALDAFRKKS